MAVETLIFPGYESDVKLMGGKAHALSKLGRKFPIPDWFVVTPDAFSDASVESEIQKALQNLGSGPYAVRSSAIDEDGADHSFAGQLQSFLNVPSSEVMEKIHAVRESGMRASVQEYRLQRGLSGDQSYPAVLVQKMVKADAAGVAFTVDPVHHNRDIIAVIATKGLADRLVSGEDNGDTYHLSRKGVLLSQQSVSNDAVLTSRQMADIAALAIKVEDYFRCPQDIEWAIQDNQLFLLQARPVTTLKADDDSIIWDNSNIVESYSGVTSPLTFSFARYVYSEVYKSFSLLMGVPRREIEKNDHVFANMLGRLQGHIYYNLLNWYRVLALFPGFTLNKAFMEQMMGVDEPLPDHYVQRITGGKASMWERGSAGWRMAGTLCCLIGNAIILPWQVKRFYKRLDRVLAQPQPPLSQRSLAQLVSYYRSLETELLARWQTPIVNDFLCMIAFGASRKLMINWCGEEGQQLHNDYMIGQGDIISAEPAQRIHRMAQLVRGQEEVISRLTAGDSTILQQHTELKSQFEDYLAKFGDRCTQELKLESLTLYEDSVTLLQAIGYTARREEKPVHAAVEGLDQRLDKCLEGHFFKRKLSHILLHWAKMRIRDRENLRFERTRVFGRVRRVFIEMGHRLVHQGVMNDVRDIFYLEVDEILGMTSGAVATADIKALVSLRQTEAEEFSRLPDLPHRFETSGMTLSSIKANITTQKPQETSGDSRKGLGCCSGIVRSTVRVIHDPRTESLRAGEILVARHTDPGWISLFSNAAGIIVERGSLLSHSAIVAREMGIPAIVAISDVMQWLKTGDVVEMDGASGAIVRISDAEK